ncbi:MAG: DUF1289 domain-containing protein [Alphaproteobacteria bacterium]
MTELNVPSPCTANCGIDKTTNLCQGCFRTNDEIRHWSVLDNETKLQIVKQLHIRRANIKGTPLRQPRGRRNR